MSTRAGDPAVEYWTRAMASVRDEEHRRRGVVVPLVLHMAAAVGAGATGYLGGHLLGGRRLVRFTTAGEAGWPALEHRGRRRHGSQEPAG